MLKIHKIGPNQTELETSKALVFFSYNTPVAALLPRGGYVRTATKYSVTTSRHINQWLRDSEAQTVPQEEIDALLD